MNVIWKAACAAALITALIIEIGCGNTFRPVSSTLPVTTGNPSGTETEVALNQCPIGSVCTGASGIPSDSVLTAINVSGDTNMGNKPLQNQVGSTVGPAGSPAAPMATATPMAFDFSRTSVYTANTATDTVTRLLLSTSTAGFSANTTTISLPCDSAPISMTFQYFGPTYTQDYVVNSGTGSTPCLAPPPCPGTGSLGAIAQPTGLLTATVCVGKTPDFAWIYTDQSKVFVLDYGESQVYVVDASLYRVTQLIPVGTGPIKAAQSNSNNGQYVYVLNNRGRTISVIDGLAETVVDTVSTDNPLTTSPPVDMAMDTNFNDTTANTQINHVWILHADGTVSVWDGTNPKALSWITSVATITPVQTAAGAFPTNLALLRDGTWAYVGVGNTDQIVGIDTTKLASPNVITLGVNPCPPALPCSFVPATSSITVGVHHLVPATGLICNAATGSGCLENTTPTVNSVAVSRQGNSAALSKAYATTTTSTTYYYYDANGSPTTPPALPAWCTTVLCPSNGNATTFPNLYNGTTVVTAEAGAEDPNTPVNYPVTTLPAPSVVTYCFPGNPATGEYDGQKNCPAMTPAQVLGRN